MKTISIIILSISLMVPTDKITCPITDQRVAVICNDVKLVKEIFQKHGLNVIWVGPSILCKYTVVAIWPNKVNKYEKVRDLFFDLAKRKEVLRIY